MKTTNVTGGSTTQDQESDFPRRTNLDLLYEAEVIPTPDELEAYRRAHGDEAATEMFARVFEDKFRLVMSAQDRADEQ